MAESTRDLHVKIEVSIEGDGPDKHWSFDHAIPVPPDYVEDDLIPFVKHQTERALAALQYREFGDSRMDMIVRQFTIRDKAVRHLIGTASVHPRVQALTALIQDVLDLDNDTLFARWGGQNVED